MLLTSAAVVAYFIRYQQGEGIWRRLIAPATACLCLGAVLLATLDQFDTLLGVQPTSPLKWMFPAAYWLTALLGIAWALTLRGWRPEAYAAIGLGANSPVMRATPTAATYARA